MKKLTSFLLAGCMLCSALSIGSISAGAVEINDFSYDTTASNTIVITDYHGKDKDVTVPAAIDGLPVTAVGQYAFSYREVESISLPSTITSIGRNAFMNCTRLKSINLPDSITRIRSGAFSSCEALEKVNIPSKLNYIEEETFESCKSITEAIIPEGVKSVDDYAFFKCENLKKVEIPNTVREIGDGAFFSCKKLEAAEIPDSVKQIGRHSFGDCLELQSAKLPKRLTEIPEEAFRNTYALTKISIPSTVSKISSNAFVHSGIKSVKLGKNVQKLGSFAFYDSGLKSVSIKKNLKKIGYQCFTECKKLKEINVDKNNTKFTSKSGVLYNKKKTMLITYPSGKPAKKFTAAKEVTEVSPYAFFCNPKLREVKFQKGLKIIGSCAFGSCAIKNVSLPSTLTKICSYAFDSCKSLEKISIPDSVTYIESYAFSDCESLSSIKFKGNSSLALDSNIFRNCTALKKVNMPVAKKSHGCLFFGCTALKKVTFSKNVKTIFSEDFAECVNLNTVTIPKNVTKIGNHALGYINLYDGEYDTNLNFVIKGVKNSAAHKYAQKNGFTFKKVK